MKSRFLNERREGATLDCGIDALYHAIPLHYVPSLLQSGALYAQSVLAARDRLESPSSEVPVGIRPRSTASRRDRMLGLADYVHLSPTPYSPLLADKLQKGYPHALLVFDAEAVLALPETALLPYNTKAWRTRACYVPVREVWERQAVFRRYIGGRHLPSLEILVKYGLTLTHLRRIAFIDDRERESIAACVASARRESDKLVVEPGLFRAAKREACVDWDSVAQYFDRCRVSGQVFSPPTVPFD